MWWNETEDHEGGGSSEWIIQAPQICSISRHWKWKTIILIVELNCANAAFEDRMIFLLNVLLLSRFAAFRQIRNCRLSHFVFPNTSSPYLHKSRWDPKWIPDPGGSIQLSLLRSLDLKFDLKVPEEQNRWCHPRPPNNETNQKSPLKEKFTWVETDFIPDCRCKANVGN